MNLNCHFPVFASLVSSGSMSLVVTSKGSDWYENENGVRRASRVLVILTREGHIDASLGSMKMVGEREKLLWLAMAVERELKSRKKAWLSWF